MVSRFPHPLNSWPKDSLYFFQLMDAFKVFFLKFYLACLVFHTGLSRHLVYHPEGEVLLELVGIMNDLKLKLNNFAPFLHFSV